jgi:hypothetical protein
MQTYELQVSTAAHEVCKEVAQWQFEGHKNPVDGCEPDSSVFTVFLSLPKSLSKCTQDVRVPRVKVRHPFSIIIEVQTSDDQKSKVGAILAIEFFEHLPSFRSTGTAV